MAGKLTLAASVALVLLFGIPAWGVTAESIPAGKAAPRSEMPDSTVATPLTESEPSSAADGTTAAPLPHFSLAELVGMTEIPVFTDVDKRYLESMTTYQLLDDDIRTVEQVDLSESIQNGRNFSRDRLAALALVDQSEAQTGQSLSQLLPSVSVRAARGYEISEPSVVVDPVTGDLLAHDRHMRTDISVAAIQPLFDLPGFLEWRRRKVREQVRQEGYRVSDGDAFLAAVESYLSLVSSRLQVSLMNDFEQELTDLLDYIEKRAGAGASSVSDMSRVKARRQQTLSSRLEQDSLHAAAGAEFVRQTNLVSSKVRLPVADDVGAALLPEAFDLLVDEAMKSNPEIAAIEADLEASRIDATAALGNFLPKLNAEYTDNYTLHAGGSDDSQRDKRIMLVASWDLVSGGKDYNLRYERQARQQELLYRLDDRRRRVIQALSANYSALETTRQRIVAGYEELESISVASEAMSARMLSGNQSLLDLLTVYDHRFEVRSRLVDLHILEMRIVAQLVRLTYGTPWALTAEESLEDNRQDQGVQGVVSKG